MSDGHADVSLRRFEGESAQAREDAVAREEPLEIQLGGAASSPALVKEVEEAFDCRCFVGYGLTESGPVSTVAHLKDSLADVSDDERIRRQAMTGFAVPGNEVRVGHTWVVSQAAQEFDAVQPRHLQVGQNEIVRLLSHPFQRFQTVVRSISGDVESLDIAGEHLPS